MTHEYEHNIDDIGLVSTTTTNFTEKEVEQLLNLTQKKKKKQNDNDILKTLSGFTYKELLEQCIQSIIAIRNKSSVEPKKLSDPIKVKYENRKTIIYDFANICIELNRTIEHVSAFILTELSTEGSVRNNNSFILGGKFSIIIIENILNRYKNIFVYCKSCNSYRTTILKDQVTRLMFMTCVNCNSHQSIKV